MNVFDYINSINNKNYIWNENSEKEFNVYVANLAFSYYEDTIIFANEINMYPNLESKQIYDYYFFSLDKKKRWAKWNKKSEFDKELIEGIAEYYKINYNRAINIMEVLSTIEKEELEKFVKAKGGNK